MEVRLEIFFKHCEIINTMERMRGHTFEDGTSNLVDDQRYVHKNKSLGIIVLHEIWDSEGTLRHDLFS